MDVIGLWRENILNCYEIVTMQKINKKIVPKIKLILILMSLL